MTTVIETDWFLGLLSIEHYFEPNLIWVSSLGFHFNAVDLYTPGQKFLILRFQDYCEGKVKKE